MAGTALITGATGFLGRQILQTFREAGWAVVGTGFSRASPPSIVKADLSDKQAVESLLDLVKPAVVIHCAANRFPDKCDSDPDGARRINVEATQHLVRACEKHSALCVYISTDYVFPGRPGEAPYEADAVPQPCNLYGQTKLDGERVVLEETGISKLGVVLRIPVLFGPAKEPKESAINVLLDAIWKAQDKDAKVEMDHWSQRYPTNTEDVARVALDIAMKYLGESKEREALPRILHFSSEDKFTKYEMCELLAEILGLPLTGMIAKKDGGDPYASIQRPYDTHLSSENLRTLGIDVWTQNFRDWWRRELKAYRK